MEDVVVHVVVCEEDHQCEAVEVVLVVVDEVDSVIVEVEVVPAEVASNQEAHHEGVEVEALAELVEVVVGSEVVVEVTNFCFMARCIIYSLDFMTTLTLVDLHPSRSALLHCTVVCLIQGFQKLYYSLL